MGAREGIAFIVAGVIVAAMGFILDSMSLESPPDNREEDRLAYVVMYWAGIGLAGIGGPIAWKHRRS